MPAPRTRRTCSRSPASPATSRPARLPRTPAPSSSSPGNTAPTTEWNINVDPDAAKVVFSAWAEASRLDGVPRPVALGLDVTERAKITPDHVVALARRAGSTPDDSVALAAGDDPMQA